MLLATLVSALLWWQPAAPAAPAPRPPLARPAGGYADPCKLFGTIYLERDPRRRGFCSATVFVEQQEAFASLVVYEEANKLFADKPGLWYVTDARDFADFTVLVTTNRSLADFGIYYTKIRSFAGCRKD